MKPKERTIQTSDDLHDVISHVTFAPSCVNLDWKWETSQVLGNKVDRGDGLLVRGWLIRASFARPDTHTGILGRGFGRWEFVPIGTSESGVVKTCWLLAELVVRHELMEAFLFRNIRIFDPHKTVAELSIGGEKR